MINVRFKFISSDFICMFFLLVTFQSSLQKPAYLKPKKGKSKNKPKNPQIIHQLKRSSSPHTDRPHGNLLMIAWSKVPDRKRGTLPASLPPKGVIRELTGWTRNVANGSTCERDLASPGNLDRVVHSKETWASGAQPDHTHPPPPRPEASPGHRRKGSAWTPPATQSYLL